MKSVLGMCKVPKVRMRITARVQWRGDARGRDERTGIGSGRVLQVVISTLYFIPVKRKAFERLYAGKLSDQI